MSSRCASRPTRTCCCATSSRSGGRTSSTLCAPAASGSRASSTRWTAPQWPAQRCPSAGWPLARPSAAWPDVTRRVRALLERLGLGDETLVMRMTGCPNGCSRPYMAEMGFVGDGPNSYQLWLGGTPAQTCLAQLYMDRVKIKDLETELEPIFKFWATNRKPNEGFGHFVSRVGLQAITEYRKSYVSESTPLEQIGLDAEAFAKLSALAAAQGKSVTHMANELMKKALLA